LNKSIDRTFAIYFGDKRPRCPWAVLTDVSATGLDMCEHRCQLTEALWIINSAEQVDATMDEQAILPLIQPSFSNSVQQFFERRLAAQMGKEHNVDKGWCGADPSLVVNLASEEGRQSS